MVSIRRASRQGMGLFGTSSRRRERDSETRISLDPVEPEVSQLTASLTAGLQDETERALAIYRHVKEHIAFGFTPRADKASPSETLRFGKGHANPQATLFMAMLHEAQIEARQHFVTISHDLVHGLFPSYALPPRWLSHSHVEVKLAGEWIPIDGYVLDSAYQRNAMALLREEGRTLGYSAHVDGAMDWDGRSPCMAQLVSDEMVVVDHGCFADPELFYTSPDYRHDFSELCLVMFGEFAAKPANERIELIRRTGGPEI